VLVGVAHDGPATYPPLGLAYLAAALRDAGYEPDIVDTALFEGREALLRRVCHPEPLAVCLSFATATQPRARDIAAAAAAAGDAVIIAGGPHATFAPEHVLQDMAAVDYVLRFEAEAGLVALLKALEAGGEPPPMLPGVAWRAGGGVALGTVPEPPEVALLPAPARDLLSLPDYPAQCRGSVLSSRGCPHGCMFCASARLFGPRYRPRAPRDVVREIEGLAAAGIDRITFVDDLFTGSRRRVLDICRLMADRGLKVSWGCETRADAVDAPLLEAMRAAGCDYVYYGTETGDPGTMERLGKGLDLDAVRTVVRLTRSLGIKVKMSVMVGLPGDTEESARHTLDFVHDVGPDGVAVLIATPLPGSPLWDRPEAFGARIVDRDLEHYDYLHPVMETEGLGADDVRRLFLEATALNLSLGGVAEEVGMGR